MAHSFNLTTWRDHRRAAVAIRSAFTVVQFGFVLLLALSVGYTLFLQQGLDYATHQAAIQVMNGSVRARGYSSPEFRARVICPNLPDLFNCGRVIVDLRTLDGLERVHEPPPSEEDGQRSYHMPEAPGATDHFGAGSRGSREYLRVIYPITFLPPIVEPLLGYGTLNGRTTYFFESTAVFRNERY